MRISTLTIYDQSVSSLHRQQNGFIDVSQQIASGRRVVRPSDDPQAASRAVGVSQSEAATLQYANARISARNSLSQEESILDSVSDAIAAARTLMIQAASDTLGDTDRSSVASELKGVLETLIGQANATDGNGRYLFGGYRDDSPPFVRDAAGTVVYHGDSNMREQRVDASRLMPVADNGNTIFLSVHGAAGYVAEADADNAGNLTFIGPRTLDPSDPNYGDAFTLTFAVSGDFTTYSINGDAPQVYQSGEPLTFGGLSLQLEGQPADGDTLVIDRAANMNTDLFATMAKAIAVLDTPAETPAEKAHLRNTMNTVLRELDNSLDNVLTVRASVGARLNELDTVDLVGEKRLLNYKQTFSDLIELDYVEAIAEYSRRQVGLQAAQRTFIDLSRLSLFQQM